MNISPAKLGFILSFVLIGSATLWANSPADADLKAVSQLVNSKVNETLTVLRDKKLKKEERVKKVKSIVEPLFKFELMAKLSLGKSHWGKFSEPQRDEFTELFIEQLQDSYIEKIELFTDETVEFSDPYVSKNKFYAPTTVLSKEKRYEVIYKLYKKDDRFWVYDLEIEGISIVTSFGMQYDQFLAKSGPTDLIKKMKAKSLDTPEAFKKTDKKTTSKENG